MRISFRSKNRRFTLSTGEDDAELYEYEKYDDADMAEAMEFLQMVDGSFELSPTEPDFEDGAYSSEDDDEEVDRHHSRRRTPHSFGFAPRRHG
jgi:hypothetical protein